jgi:hypothetical protein
MYSIILYTYTVTLLTPGHTAIILCVVLGVGGRYRGGGSCVVGGWGVGGVGGWTGISY